METIKKKIKTSDQNTVAWSDNNNNIQLKITNYVLTGKSDP